MGNVLKGMKLVLGIALYFVLGTMVASAAGFEAAYMGGVVAVAMASVPMGLDGALASTPTLTALAGYGGKYEKKIFSTLRNSLDLLNDTTVIPGIKNKLNLTKLTVADGVRKYREQFDDADTDLTYRSEEHTSELQSR